GANSDNIEICTNLNDINPVNIYNNTPYFIIQGSYEKPLSQDDIQSWIDNVNRIYSSVNNGRGLETSVNVRTDHPDDVILGAGYVVSKEGVSYEYRYTAASWYCDANSCRIFSGTNEKSDSAIKEWENETLLPVLYNDQTLKGTDGWNCIKSYNSPWDQNPYAYFVEQWDLYQKKDNPPGKVSIALKDAKVSAEAGKSAFPKQSQWQLNYWGSALSAIHDWSVDPQKPQYQSFSPFDSSPDFAKTTISVTLLPEPSLGFTFSQQYASKLVTSHSVANKIGTWNLRLDAPTPDPNLYDHCVEIAPGSSMQLDKPSIITNFNLLDIHTGGTAYNMKWQVLDRKNVVTMTL